MGGLTLLEYIGDLIIFGTWQCRKYHGIVNSAAKPGIHRVDGISVDDFS